MPADAYDLEFGRSLARGFTGVDRPGDLLSYVAAAAVEADLAARLTGVTWALTARRMNDADYLERCLDTLASPQRAWLAQLPDLCQAALGSASGYGDWQSRTREALMALHAREPVPA